MYSKSNSEKRLHYIFFLALQAQSKPPVLRVVLTL